MTETAPSTAPAPTPAKLTEYVISWKWLLGGLIVFLVCGSALGGLYYYRNTNMASHVMDLAAQMVADADAVREQAKTETDETKKRELGREALKMKEDAAKLLDNFNRAQRGNAAILKALNTVLESLYKDEGGGRARAGQIERNCNDLIQALASVRESLPYHIRLMELAWERRNLSEVFSRAREVLRIERSLNKPENYDALRYIALASMISLPNTGYSPTLLQMPFLDEKLDKLLEKVYLMKPSDIEIASRYAEFIIDVNRETFKLCASDELLRETTPEKRREMAQAVIDEMVSRNPTDIAAYLARFQFRVRFQQALMQTAVEGEELDADLKKVLELDPKSADGLIRAAMYTFQQRSAAQRAGNAELAESLKKRAEVFLNRTIEDNPTFGIGYQYLGDYLNGEGKVAEAVKVWGTGLEKSVHPAPEELIGRMAVELMVLKRFDEAVKVLARLNALVTASRISRPNATPQIRRMSILLSARLNAAEGNEALVRAEESQVAGQDAEARRLFSLARRKTADALNSLDTVLKSFGVAPSDYVLERTSIYAKLLPESLMLAGRLMADQAKWDQAAKYYRTVIPFSQFREAATIAAADAHRQMNQSTEAVRLLADAVAQSPDSMAIRYLYMRSLFQEQMQRNDTTQESLDAVEEQLRILQAHQAEMAQPWTVDLRIIQLEMMRATITNDPEQILDAQLAATRRYRELENMPFPPRPNEATPPEDAPKVYADDLNFLIELANIYSGLAALSDFDRVLSLMRDKPNGEAAYFSALINDAMSRNDREGAQLVIEQAIASTVLTASQKQRFVLLMRNLNDDSPNALERIYDTLKSSFDVNPDQLRPQAFFLLANMAIDRGDIPYAKTLQGRLEQIEGAPAAGTWWRYVKARIMLVEPEPNYEELRLLQEEIVIRRETWDLAYLLRAMIEDSFCTANPDNLEARAKMVESYQMALRNGNAQPAVWNRLLALFDADDRAEDARQLRREALVRGIQLDARTGQFPQPYQRMYTQVLKSIQDEAPQEADTVAQQCLVLARSRKEPPALIFSLNLALGNIFFSADLYESAERHLKEVAKSGGVFVYPLAICLAQNKKVDEGYTLILDEIDRTPSSMRELIPSLLICISRVRPSEAIFQRIDKLMGRIENGERLTLRPSEPTAANEENFVPLGTRRIRSMVVRFPGSDVVPEASGITVFPPEEEEKMSE